MSVLPFDLDGLDEDEELAKVTAIAERMTLAIPRNASLGQAMCAAARVTASIIATAKERQPKEDPEGLIIDLIKILVKEMGEEKDNGNS